MSIEKIDFELVKQQKKTFTTHFNSVLQNLRNPIALGIWAYLSSLPEGWIVNRKHLMNHFGLGRDKLNSALNYLKDNNLLETGQERLESGKIGKGYIIVKCGYDFVQDVNEKKLSTPHTDLPYPVKPGAGKSAPIYKIDNIKENKKQREGRSVFEPDKHNQELAQRLGIDIKAELHSFVEKRPHCTSQAEFEIWLKHAKDYRDRQESKKRSTNTNEPKCTAKFFDDPSHPDYERYKKLKEMRRGDDAQTH